MHKVLVALNGENRILDASDGELLSEVLIENGIETEHPCGGAGLCKKCVVRVDGEDVLSCKYRVTGDIKVHLPEKESIATNAVTGETGEVTDEMCLCLDIGSTTLVLALVSLCDGKIVKSVTRNNPQRSFASDVMGRIEYAMKNGVKKLQDAVMCEVGDMISVLLNEMEIDDIDVMYVAGNSVMLHLFCGVDPSGMGCAPYTPRFLKSQRISAHSLRLRRVREIVTVDMISAFVGGDIVAGLNYAKMPSEGKFNILIDLGTNAEVVLYSNEKIYCTAAAAGPCFEGVNISSGMSAVDGAIYSYTGQGYKTVGEKKPRGLCATGLIDAIWILRRYAIIDESGFMEDGEFEIAPNVKITQNDIRQFQVAKSAICSATETLLEYASINRDAIEKVFVAGGFASKMNVGNAFGIGLLPKNLKEKTRCENNTSLLGTIKYALGERLSDELLERAEYVDLAKNEFFKERFIENMAF